MRQASQTLISEERRIIAANVRRLRGMDLSREDLAFRSGLDIRTIQNIESPRMGQEPRMSSCIRVAHVLGTTVVALREKRSGTQ